MLAITEHNSGFDQSLIAEEESAALEFQNLDQFLAFVEARAYRLALFAVKHEDDALDIVQDSMLKFATHYADKPIAEWQLLFYRILQNCIKDHFRRHNVRSRWTVLIDHLIPKHHGDEANDMDPLEAVADESSPDGEAQLASEQRLSRIEATLSTLPLRQQQAFLLRCWEGLSTRDTADAMGCSEGSVKTHYFRALAAMKTSLQDY